MSKEFKTFTFVFILVGIYQLLSHTLDFYIPIYLKNLGLSGFEIGVLFSLVSIAALITIFEAGIFADRFTSKRMITIGLVILAIFFLAFSFTTTFWVLTLLFLIWGIGTNILVMAFDSFTLRKITKKEKGKEFGWYQMAKTIPGALGYLLGGVILAILPFNIFIRIIGIILLSLVFITQLVPKTSQHKERVSKYIKDFKNKKVLIFSLFIFLFTQHWGVESVAYGLYLKEYLHLSFSSMGLFIAGAIFFLSITTYIIGKKRDRGLSIKAILTFAFLLSGMGFFGMGITHNVGVAFACRIIHEIGDGAFIIFLFDGASSYFGKNRIGGDWGIVILVTIIARFVSALIFSPIGEKYGYNVPHYISGAIMIITAGAFYLYQKYHYNKKTITTTTKKATTRKKTSITKRSN